MQIYIIVIFQMLALRNQLFLLVLLGIYIIKSMLDKYLEHCLLNVFLKRPINNALNGSLDDMLSLLWGIKATYPIQMTIWI